jgi:caa(3)-type oxidase subunit IV
MSGHVSPKSVYYSIFGALMVLTVITVAAAFVNLGSLNFPVALAIAIIKATLVVLFFMHVKYSSRLTKLVVLPAHPAGGNVHGLRHARLERAGAGALEGSGSWALGSGLGL